MRERFARSVALMLSACCYGSDSKTNEISTVLDRIREGLIAAILFAGGSGGKKSRRVCRTRVRLWARVSRPVRTASR